MKNHIPIKQKYFLEEKVWVSISKMDCKKAGIMEEEWFSYIGPAEVLEFHIRNKKNGRVVPYFLAIPLNLKSSKLKEQFFWFPGYVIKWSLDKDEED